MNFPTIPPLDLLKGQQALDRQNRLTKPQGALGDLETLSARLVSMTANASYLPTRRAVIVCAGDHGVTAQGVSAYPSDVTAQMVLNFLAGGAAVNVLARQMNARVTVVDAGVKVDLPPHPDLVQGKIGYGTHDFTVEPAMSFQQAQASLELGMRVIADEIQRGLDIVVVGEMGIGNTTSASAIIAHLTNHTPAEVTGYGTGVSESARLNKIHKIERALLMHRPSPAQVLETVGGFEIGTMAGIMIGAASARVPILLDGLISTAAALIACVYCPTLPNYLIGGHQSAEPGHRVALAHLGLSPLLQLNLRLGEGSGAVLALPLVEAAMRTLHEMATFGEAGVSESDAE
ncbi:MAG: nicotinate-nucleotide--dimethylbenzimidazole phosphoribosyltransferase [Phototrophicaceae bacterium]